MRCPPLMFGVSLLQFVCTTSSSTASISFFLYLGVLLSLVLVKMTKSRACPSSRCKSECSKVVRPLHASRSPVMKASHLLMPIVPCRCALLSLPDHFGFVCLSASSKHKRASNISADSVLSPL